MNHQQAQAPMPEEDQRTLLDSCLRLVETELGVIARYEEHKEKMAWAATAFYVPTSRSGCSLTGSWC